jgi:hypothetical protein
MCDYSFKKVLLTLFVTHFLCVPIGHVTIDLFIVYVFCNTLVLTLFCVTARYILVTNFTCSIYVLQYSTTSITFYL